MAELRPHYIDVDLKKNTQYNVPVVTQNDTATHFIIRVTDDGLTDPELLDAYQEITMTSQRPDGESFYLTGTRIPGTNEIEFHLGTDETAFHGSVLASLQFYLVEDASRYTSAQFRYDVKKDLTKNYTPTQREETLVEVVLKEGPGVIQEAKDAKIAVDGALVELEQDKTAAIDRLDEVTEENKTIFREPVATFAALSTTYPNPEHGTTVRVTSEAASYRYSDGTWVKTDEYNPTAIDQVTAQLAETDAEARRKKELEDLSPAVLAAIEGGEGTEFNLLSIPQDGSVTPEKVDPAFLNKIRNDTGIVIEDPSNGYAERPNMPSVTWVGVNAPLAAEPLDEWRSLPGFVYFTDFGEYAHLQNPTGWQVQWGRPAITHEVADSNTTDNGKVFRVNSNNERFSTAWTDVKDEFRADIEVYTLLKTSLLSNSLMGSLIVRGGGEPGKESGYIFGPRTTSGDTTIRLAKYNNGIATTLMDMSSGIVFSEYFHMVLRVDGQRIRAKFWQEHTPEPSGWQMDVIDPSPLTNKGFAGIFRVTESGNRLLVSRFGVGTGGMTAPRRALL